MRLQAYLGYLKYIYDEKDHKWLIGIIITFIALYLLCIVVCQ